MSERFLILCRNLNPAAARLKEVLSEFGPADVIIDERSADGTLESQMAGYHRLAGFTLDCKPITAWERAFFQLEATICNDSSNIWFVEDDVAGNRESFASLVKRTQEVNADLSARHFFGMASNRLWPHWWHARDYFDFPYRSFNPLCRLSSSLLKTVLDFRASHQRFVFQEVLFASVAALHDMTYFDWMADETAAPLFGEFRFRPEVTAVGTGISHPVKNPSIHQHLCS